MYLKHSVLLYFNTVLGPPMCFIVRGFMFCTVYSIVCAWCGCLMA